MKNISVWNVVKSIYNQNYKDICYHTWILSHMCFLQFSHSKPGFLDKIWRFIWHFNLCKVQNDFLHFIHVKFRWSLLSQCTSKDHKCDQCGKFMRLGKEIHKNVCLKQNYHCNVCDISHLRHLWKIFHKHDICSFSHHCVHYTYVSSKIAPITTYECTFRFTTIYLWNLWESFQVS
jgi:hypothetical protein